MDLFWTACSKIGKNGSIIQKGHGHNFLGLYQGSSDIIKPLYCKNCMVNFFKKLKNMGQSVSSSEKTMSKNTF